MLFFMQVRPADSSTALGFACAGWYWATLKVDLQGLPFSIVAVLPFTAGLPKGDILSGMDPSPSALIREEPHGVGLAIFPLEHSSVCSPWFNNLGGSEEDFLPDVQWYRNLLLGAIHWEVTVP